MRWWKRFLGSTGAAAIVGGIAGVSACSPEGWGFDQGADDALSPDPHPACPGLCVHTPPATYTGPSLFWIGMPPLVKTCPPDTPYQGIQGFVTSPMPLEFARECRITATDACTTEGLTCAPFPDADYHVCIHHDDDRACPNEYPQRRTMIDDASETTVTLCCLDSLAPS